MNIKFLFIVKCKFLFGGSFEEILNNLCIMNILLGKEGIFYSLIIIFVFFNCMEK